MARRRKKRFSYKRAMASSNRAIARYHRLRKTTRKKKYAYRGKSGRRKKRRSVTRGGKKRGLKKGHKKSAKWRRNIGLGVARAHKRGAYRGRKRRTTRRRRRA